MSEERKDRRNEQAGTEKAPAEKNSPIASNPVESRRHDFSRRVLLAASWSVPVALAVSTSSSALSPAVASDHLDSHLDFTFHQDGHDDHSDSVT